MIGDPQALSRWRVLSALVAILCVALAAPPRAQDASAPASLTLVSKDGRRTVPTINNGGREMIALDDIANLWKLRDDRYAVMCVHHDHVPTEDTKFLGAAQTRYEKKNWSSVMLMNCARCTALTPEYVNTASGLELHRFHWLAGDELIGEIPHRWNHLVDYDPPRPASELSMLHYTKGGPYFEQYRNSGYADLWFAERDRMLAAG